MSNKFNCENFIFEKNNFVNDILLDDIIDNYQIVYEKDNCCDFVIMYDETFSKFKSYLLKEMTNALYLYNIQLNKYLTNEKTKQYFRNILLETRISNFKISSKLFNNIELDVIHEPKMMQCYDKSYSHKITILKFVLFMNDYDGEIFICNHKIIPQKGKLIIFPASRIFPYQEINSKTSKIITISGSFYNTM
jgi:hypothetical protein